MRIAFAFITLFVFTGCFLKRNHSYSDHSYGVVSNPIDSNLKNEIRLVHFGRTVGVVFPGEYGKRSFGTWGRSKNKTYFTPDTNLIKAIDQEIFNQYCNAIGTYWQKQLANSAEDTTHKPVNKTQTAANTIASKYCTLWKETFPFYDRQYLGYRTATGEKIIVIKLIDFRADPHQLKPSLSVSWIEGWHGWFYSNVIQLLYHIDNNQLTLEES